MYNTLHKTLGVLGVGENKDKYYGQLIKRDYWVVVYTWLFKCTISIKVVWYSKKKVISDNNFISYNIEHRTCQDDQLIYAS